DLLELRRQDRASLYDLSLHHPAPLVPHERCVAVAERVEPQGVTRSFSEGAAAGAVAAALRCAPDVVAVSLLHSYLYPGHERAMATALRHAAPALDVVLSSEVLPEIREYERTATTVAEAYLRPGVARYVVRLDEMLQGAGYPSLAVMTSAGGMRSATDATRSAAALALSGPAGGVAGAAFVARLMGIRDALTLDIGGTSADAGIILDGEPLTEPGGEVAGVPIALPRVLVDTVSAGGGSIGWVDPGGALRVGPRSAGAHPGPAAFGQGGADATLTDAHLVLGVLQHERLSGGVALHDAAARAAIRRLAALVASDAGHVAKAMVRIANASMARALRRVSVERGVDPRRCTLIAFGGGGPLHACALAGQLGMRTVLVPPFAGVLSALGLALAAERREGMTSVMRRADALTEGDITPLCASLAARAQAGATHRWWARVRYEGQGHELDVTVSPGEDGAVVASRFAAMHRSRYGFTLERPVEVIGLRHAATSAARTAHLARRGHASWDEARVDNGGDIDATVRGPAVITLPDASLLVEEAWTARALPLGGWLLERDA
ncbi:MAG: hydantoinase/oxoprolinase family protein, partial [Gemmatimonadaceae bacterium]